MLSSAEPFGVVSALERLVEESLLLSDSDSDADADVDAAAVSAFRFKFESIALKSILVFNCNVVGGGWVVDCGGRWTVLKTGCTISKLASFSAIIPW